MAEIITKALIINVAMITWSARQTNVCERLK